MAAVTLTYEAGTIRIEGDLPDNAPGDLPGVEPDPRSGVLRAPAFQYAPIRDALDDGGIAYDDRVLALSTRDRSTTYDLRAYQREALDAWEDAGRRGVLELPTGSGKTVIAIATMAELGDPTLVVVPTVDLLQQWRAELDREFEEPVGQLGGGAQRVEDLTVGTYDSAYLRAEELGDRFGFVVFDEAHHLGGEGYREVARLLAAPARMGLTATFQRPDGAHVTVAELVGDLVYDLSASDLAGDHLAPYDVRRIEVELTAEERDRYERHQGTFTDYLARSGIRMESGRDYQELVKRSGTDPEAREALLAKQHAREVMMNADRKVDELAAILDEHRDDRVLVFCAHNDMVYRLAERFLLPAVTHRT
ncbi:MAG: DEAD/DEAH box helicase family protein, partial [Halobacteriales archaeon]